MPFDFEQSSYIALREAALPDTHRLVVWCGAGLGRPAQLPGWTALRRHLEGRLYEKARSLDGGERISLERQMNSVQGQTDIWVAFQILQRLLGPTTYRDSIREVLNPAINQPIPDAYLKLWHMRIAGMVTLNIDNLAIRAHTVVHPGKQPIMFTGNEVASHMYVLRTTAAPFLCHLHGTDTDTTSWVFTRSELSNLMKSDPYQIFVNSILTNFTVLFIGISADDVAVGGHLKRLVDNKIDFGSHFWITQRNDRATDRWAENTSIRTIYYRASGGDHSELNEMLDALVSYVPDDDSTTEYPPALVGSSLTPVSELPSPAELRSLDPDETRTLLNQKALDILRPENLRRDQQFAEFVRTYGREIHSAWYVSTYEGENMLVGYKLIERHSRGAFGQIYRAEAPDGSPVAIKILKEEVRTDPQLLHSFRRGVRAMRILSDHNVRGMVAYKEASEIPAFVVMDWIDGYDLRQAIEMKLLDGWGETIYVALRMASILKEAHSLPERVLHRDLRPANIMIKRDRPNRPWTVYLLDFDLSWYLGSIEQSVIHGSDSYGYLAPEQIRRRDGASSRHPAVDSYGLGMTMYFMVSGQNPSSENHLHEDWEEGVYAAASRRMYSSWVSIPKRFVRLILNMTHDRQSSRWDLAQIVLELDRMLEAVRRPRNIRFADMLAEEVAARSNVLSQYDWEPDRQAAVLAVSQAGLSIELAGDDSNHRIKFRISRIRAEDDRQRAVRRASEGGQTVANMLRGAGWEVETSKAGYERIIMEAYMDVDKVASNIDGVVASINRAEAEILKIY